MNVNDLLKLRKPKEIEEVIKKYLKKGYKFIPVGGVSNNAGPIEVATESVSPLVERTTNMFDGILELHATTKGSGQTLPQSPREAVARWSDVKGGHVFYLSPDERQVIANQAQIIMDESGSGKDKFPTIIFRDHGIGLHPTDWANTVLSLNKGNKLDKPFLAGAYGQGGSSSFSFCTYTVIVSRRNPQCLGNRTDVGGWSIVRINDSDETLKNAVYEYLVDANGNVPLLADTSKFDSGTYIAHIAYNAGQLISKMMTINSYRIFNNILFDPILPYWIKDLRHKNNNRSMGGHISRLLPEGKNVDYYGEYTKYLDVDSKLAIRYWVFKVKSEDGKKSFLEGFVETQKSPDTILITLNGQKQGTLTKSFIKQKGLSFLSNYLLVQIECDGLDRKMKRSLFASTREKAKNGDALEIIKTVLSDVLSEDDELQQLENVRKQMQTSQMDEESNAKVRKLLDKYISKYLTSTRELVAATEAIPNGETKTKLGQVLGNGSEIVESKKNFRVGENNRVAPPPAPILPNDPPTFLKITSSDPLKINPGASAWIRIECDAPDNYLNRPINAGSMVTLFSGLDGAKEEGRTNINGGRMRLKISIPKNSEAGVIGNCIIKLDRNGLEPLIATCAVLVEEQHRTKEGQEPIQIKSPTPVAPPYDIRSVSKGDEMWDLLGWDEGVVADYRLSQGELLFYVSVSNEDFMKEKEKKKSPELVAAFISKYIAMISYNLWLHFQQELEGKVIDEDARQQELKRTASTLILSMRSEAELDQSED